MLVCGSSAYQLRRPSTRIGSFAGEVRIDPLTEPGLVVAPLQALLDKDFADPTAAHANALGGQVRNPAIQGPRRKGQAQLGRARQGGGDDGAALLGGIGRRPSGSDILLQPAQASCVEAV